MMTRFSLSNIHRQSLYNSSDVGKSKVRTVKDKMKLINSNTKVEIYELRLNNTNFKKIINDYDFVVDGSDNFKTKF